jgi:hypothetical protein
MDRLRFRQMPIGVKVAVAVAFFTAWVSFEEFVINRTGLWQYMPFYKTAAGCAWDVAVAIIIGVGLWRAERSA